MSRHAPVYPGERRLLAAFSPSCLHPAQSIPFPTHDAQMEARRDPPSHEPAQYSQYIDTHVTYLENVPLRRKLGSLSFSVIFGDVREPRLGLLQVLSDHPGFAGSPSPTMS